MRHLLVDNLRRGVGLTAPRGEFVRGSLPDPRLCERLMTPSRLLDILMRGGVGLPQVRCLRDGTDLHPNAYTTTFDSRRGANIPIIDMPRLTHLLAGGMTLVADAVDAVDPVLEVACRALRWWTRETVRVNAYLTTGATTGFPLHWDDHDVIVVQVAGTKDWEVRGASRPAPMFRDAARNDEPPVDVEWSGELRPGDALYIPRGCWHRARCPGGYSLHLTFGFTRRTGVDWLRWVADQSRQLQLMREDLPRDDQATDHARELAEAARLMHDERSVARMLVDIEATRPATRHVSTGGLFGPPQAVVCVTDFPPKITKTAGEVVVEAAGKRLRFAAAARPALRLLLSGAPVALNSPVHEGLVAQVAELLVQEDLCAEMTESLWSGYTGLVPTDGCSSTR